jgi:hypothetical protein
MYNNLLSVVGFRRHGRVNILHKAYFQSTYFAAAAWRKISLLKDSLAVLSHHQRKLTQNLKYFQRLERQDKFSSEK